MKNTSPIKGILKSRYSHRESCGSSSIIITECSTKYNSNSSNETDDPKFTVFNNKYNIVKELGEGSSSTVYMCESIQD